MNKLYNKLIIYNVPTIDSHVEKWYLRRRRESEKPNSKQ